MVLDIDRTCKVTVPDEFLDPIMSEIMVRDLGEGWQGGDQATSHSWQKGNALSRPTSL